MSRQHQPPVPASQAATPFPGFPRGARATAVPSILFTQLLPLIDDADELRVTLYAIYALGRRKRYPRFISERELQAEAPLMAALGDGGDFASRARLRNGLTRAVERGALLQLTLTDGGEGERLYFLNAPPDQRAVAQIKAGRLDLGRPLAPEAEPPASQRRNVFQLYEANIGPLTPLVAEALKEAEELYPYEWLEEALREAALLNKRSWRYAAAILRRWATEGRKREEAGRDPDAAYSARAQILRRYRGLGG